MFLFFCLPIPFPSIYGENVHDKKRPANSRSQPQIYVKEKAALPHRSSVSAAIVRFPQYRGR